jgi:hypothetical protein
MTKNLEEVGIKVREYRHGAWNGEFPTIIVAVLSGITGGMLGAIGKDIWKVLKDRLKKRFHALEQDRQAKKDTRAPRSHVFSVYIVTLFNGVPVIYYSIPAESQIHLDFNKEELLCLEAEIERLIKGGLINKDRFVGINLAKVGGASLSIFTETPSQQMMAGPEAFKSRQEKTIEEMKNVLGQGTRKII